MNILSIQNTNYQDKSTNNEIRMITNIANVTPRGINEYVVFGMGAAMVQSKFE